MKRRPLPLALLLAVFPLLFGCASLNVNNMVSDNAARGIKHPATTALTVSGGSPGVQWFSGTITPKQFEDAVRMSLQKAPLFADLAASDTAAYLLNVKLTYAGSHPGFSMTAWVNADWTLVERTSGRTAWQATIKGEGRATAGEAFSGAKRQFMALERSAKSNIDQALLQLGELQLSEP